MSTNKTRVCVLLSSCPDTTDAKWKPGEVREVSQEAFLVRIVPEKGRASQVFRLYHPNMVRLLFVEDKLGNPYGIFGEVLEAFMGVSRYSLDVCVLQNVSGNLWDHWNGRATSNQIVKRSKFQGANVQEYHCGAFNVYFQGANVQEYHCGAFNVYQDGEEIDTVFYSKTCNVDADEVRRALVEHDGYSPSIEVYEEGKGCPVCKGELGECCAACGFVG